jgi:hypothetical protein
MASTLRTDAVHAFGSAYESPEDLESTEDLGGPSVLLSHIAAPSGHSLRGPGITAVAGIDGKESQ